MTPYQIRHTFSGSLYSAWPGLQEKAWANSGMFTTTPLIRYWCGEWGLVRALRRRASGRSPPQSHWAKPTKKRC